MKVMRVYFLCSGTVFLRTLKYQTHFCRQFETSINLLKFIYSEKATKFCEISTVDLTVTIQDKSTVEISQKFVAFSEYMNFNILFLKKEKICNFSKKYIHPVKWLYTIREEARSWKMQNKIHPSRSSSEIECKSKLKFL